MQFAIFKRVEETWFGFQFHEMKGFFLVLVAKLYTGMKFG